MNFQNVQAGSLIEFSNSIEQLIDNNKVFIICDSNTESCSTIFEDKVKFKNTFKITIEAGEENKNIDQVLRIWTFLNNNKANKNDWIINVGGGMICDLGGFAASSFKRGISFINIPTSLLGMVDAAIGGKTGFNLNALKNNIGTFYPAKLVVCDAIFLKTLPEHELKSGFAEVIKHALISDYKFWNKIKNQSFEDYNFHEIINFSINHKLNIVEKDPKENGSRKKLNFGHTIGHALESHFLSLNKTIFHGFAVAQGMAIEAFISYKLNHISKEKYTEIKEFIFSIYQPIAINKNDIKTLVGFMSNDKKNENTKINFTLLDDIGSAVYDKYISAEDIDNLMHDFYSYD